MKRWWPWVLVGVGLLAGAFTVMLLLPPAPPFEFLRGQEPVDPIVGHDMHLENYRHGLRTTFYSFRADYDQVSQRAITELREKGFKEPTVTPRITWLTRSEPGPVKGKPSADYAEITIMRNYRVRRGEELPAIDNNKGWVTVMIVGVSQGKGPFERFREWLGL